MCWEELLAFAVLLMIGLHLLNFLYKQLKKNKLC